MWWAYYLFGVAASGRWLNWTLVGPIFLNVLFLPPQASLDVTETLSSKKYKSYAEYQGRPCGGIQPARAASLRLALGGLGPAAVTRLSDRRARVPRAAARVSRCFPWFPKPPEQTTCL